MRHARTCLLTFLSQAILFGLAVTAPADTGAAAERRQEDRQLHAQGHAGKAWSLDDLKDKKAVVVLFLGTRMPDQQPLPAAPGRAAQGVRRQGRAVPGHQLPTARHGPAHRRACQDTTPPLPRAARTTATSSPTVFGAQRHARSVRARPRAQDPLPRPHRRPVRHRLPAPEADRAATWPRRSTKCWPARRSRTPSDAGRRLPHRPRALEAEGATAPSPSAKHVAPHPAEALPGMPPPRPDRPDAAADATTTPSAGRRRSAKWSTTAGCRPGTPTRSTASSPTTAACRRKSRSTLLAWIEQGCPKGDDKDLPSRARSSPTAGGSASPTWSSRCRARVHGAGRRRRAWRSATSTSSCRPTSRRTSGSRRPRRSRATARWCITSSSTWPTGGRTAASATAQDGIGDGFLVGLRAGRHAGASSRRARPRRCPRASKLVFQMHYTPNGTEQKDRSSVGLIFAKEPPKQRGAHAGHRAAAAVHPAGRGEPQGQSRRPTFAQGHAADQLSCRTCTCAARASSTRWSIPTARRRCCCRCRSTTSTGRAPTAGEAAAAAGRHAHRVHGALRQLGRTTRTIPTRRSRSAGATRPGKR